MYLAVIGCWDTWLIRWVGIRGAVGHQLQMQRPRAKRDDIGGLLVGFVSKIRRLGQSDWQLDKHVERNSLSHRLFFSLLSLSLSLSLSPSLLIQEAYSLFILFVSPSLSFAGVVAGPPSVQYRRVTSCQLDSRRNQNAAVGPHVCKTLCKRQETTCFMFNVE